MKALKLNNSLWGLLRTVPLLALCLAAGCTQKGQGIAELKRLCEKDAGFEIYRTVEAAGFHHQSGDFNLVQSPYAFIEFCNETGFWGFKSPGPGCYRVEKIKRSAGTCHEELDATLSEFIVDPFPGFLADSCVAVESITAPSARYSYLEELQQWFATNKVSRFTRVESRIVDKTDQSVLARFINYSFDRNPQYTGPTSCKLVDSVYPSYAQTNMIETVIEAKQ